MQCKLVCTYDRLNCPFLQQQSRDDITRDRLFTAIQQQEFLFHFQPQFDKYLNIIQIEALLRWRHNGQNLLPAAFIPFIEEDTQEELRRAIDREVLRLTGEVFYRWRNIPELQDIPLAINIFPQDLTCNLFDTLHGMIQDKTIPAQRLVLEITEAYIEKSREEEVASVLERLSGELGLTLSLDDFGVAGASMLRFSTHPYTEIKLDRAVIQNLNHRTPRVQQRTRDSISHILAQAQAYGCSVIAEGIQNNEDYMNCRLLGLSRYQGFFFYPPLQEKTLLDLVNNHQPVNDTMYTA